MSNLKIEGRALIGSSPNPVPNVLVEFRNNNEPKEIVATCLTNTDGRFSMEFDAGLSQSIADKAIDLSIRATYNTTVVSEQQINDYSTPANLAIAVPEEMLSLFAFTGTLKDKNGHDLADATINVSRLSFNNKQPIISMAVGNTGAYTLKIDKALIAAGDNEVKVGLLFEVTTPDSTAPVAAKTVYHYDAAEATTINFESDAANTKDKVTILRDAVLQIIGDTPIESLTDEQVAHIAAATQQSESVLQNIVNSHKAAADSGLHPDLFYAILHDGKYPLQAIQDLRPRQVKAQIENAVTANAISADALDDIDTALPLLNAYQVAQLKQRQVSNESHTVGDVFTAMFDNEAERDEFLALYHSDYDSLPQFWNDVYTPAYGEEAAKKAQQGLKLAAITGFQPQMVARLTGEIDAHDIRHMSQLAKWDTDKWTGVVGDVCAQNETLCVPASIRGEETDHTNTAIHEQYATHLKTIVQAAYPLTSIAGRLENEDGTALIADDTMRGKVTAFINNHPSFDLRTQSIHDINADDFDIAPEDIAHVQEHLAPFQRILRLADGNPDAVCALIADEVHSAKAICDMGKEQFMEAYGHLFPLDEGSTEAQPAISSRLSTGAAFGLRSAGAVFASAYAVGTTAAMGLTGALTATGSSSPSLPTTFPGGYTTMPTDNPVLSSLFGGMDYCQCCDCMSIQSPAAYLTDLIHFLKNHAPDVYDALVDKRPDILNIDLTCKNSDTPVSYIDLVIELLELQLLKPVASTFISGTPADSLTVLLKPVLKITTPSPTVSGHYQFTLSADTDFVNAYPLASSYATTNALSYLYLENFSTPGAIGSTSSPSTYMPDKSVAYNFTADPSIVPPPIASASRLLIWPEDTSTNDTVTFVDNQGNKAQARPIIIMNGNGTLNSYFVPHLNVEVVSATPANTTVRLTRSHVSVGSLAVLYLDWILPLGVTAHADPADPTNANKAIVTLAPGTYTIGVRGSYGGHNADEPGLPPSYTSVAFRINHSSDFYLPTPLSTFSFQTTGTKEQLQAYPEHTYKDSTGAYQDFTRYADGVPYKWIYDEHNLGGAVYPYSLPFNLAIEETRVYLENFGTSRLEVLKLMNPVSPLGAKAVQSEFLGIEAVSRSIIDGTHPDLATSLWKFYGFSLVDGSTVNLYITDPNTFATINTFVSGWRTVLSSRIDILLQQTGLTYAELLQCLTTNYLNPFMDGTTRQASIVAYSLTDPAAPDTCELDKLKLYFNTPTDTAGVAHQTTFYDKLHRFVRLLKTGRLSVYQWDILLSSFGDTNINEATFSRYGEILLLADKLNIAPEILAGLWSNISNVRYRDFANGSNDSLPSMYERIFTDKAVLNSNHTNAFIDPASLPTAYINSSTSFSYLPQIAGMCSTTEAELKQLLIALGITDLTAAAITWKDLSRVYVLSVLAKTSGYPVADLLVVLNWTEGLYAIGANFDPAHPEAFDNVKELLNTLSFMMDAISQSGFKVAELNYIFNSTTNSQFAPDEAKIRQFYETLRAALQKLPEYTSPVDASAPPPDSDILFNKYVNLIYQSFSKEFGISIDFAADLLYNSSFETVHNKLIFDLVQPHFVKSTYNLYKANVDYIDGLPPATILLSDDFDPANDGNLMPPFKLQVLYNWYVFFYKLTFVCKKLGLTRKELQYLMHTNHYALLFFLVHVNANEGILGWLGTDPFYKPYFLDFLFICQFKKMLVQSGKGEDSFCRLLGAASLVNMPTTAKFTTRTSEEGIIVYDPGSYFNDPSQDALVNECFNVWLTEMNRPEWNDMLQEVVGNSVNEYRKTVLDTTGAACLAIKFGDYNPDSLPSGGSYYMSLKGSSLYGGQGYNFYQNIIGILSLCLRLGISPLSLKKLVSQDVTLDDSRGLILALKGKYDDASWAQVAQPLRDKVRVMQRDALIAYTMTKPNIIFGNLLIDVEMDACMVTSRVKQALSSIQLLVDRVLLGLEYKSTSSTPSQITMPADAAAQWQQWRKWYAIWQGNRQIFFYPENWMEPELRDDKSKFFEELEAELKQNDITYNTAQDAIYNYLDKLQEVSQLEPVGMCDEVVGGVTTTHVFAKTDGGAPRYYHRKVIYDMWTPWERVDMQISGNHVTPCVHDGRLYLFWLTFTEKVVHKTPSMIAISAATLESDATKNKWFYNDNNTPVTNNMENTDQVYTQLEVALNWTEYKNSQWQKQCVGAEKLPLNIQPWVQSMVAERIRANNGLESSIFNGLMKNGQLNVLDFIKSRFFLRPEIINDTFCLTLLFPTYANTTTSAHSEFGDFLKAFTFNNGRVEVLSAFTPLHERFLPPASCYFQNNKMVSLYNASLDIDSYTEAVDAPFFMYDWNSNNMSSGTTPYPMRTRTGHTRIVNASNYRIVPNTGFDNPLADKFMYRDSTNTFYVRRVFEPFTYRLASTGGSLGITSSINISSILYSSSVSGMLGPLTAHNDVQPRTIVLPTPTIMYPSGSNYYIFQTLYHPHINDFIRAINQYGLQGLMRPDLLATPLNLQAPADTMAFTSAYVPNTDLVTTPYPQNTVQFEYNATYSVYNWELFYHIPMLIAQRLSDNQRFDEARQWFHFIFDPTKYATTADPSRFWVFKPFIDIASSSITTLDELLNAIHANNDNAVAQVNLSANDPFQPYAIGRMRPLAFMKNTLMKYLDNLIAWGDHLFARDTIESINEATQLYILAANLLGHKPQEVLQRIEKKKYSYNQLNTAPLSVDDIGEGAVPIESYIDPGAATPSSLSAGVLPTTNVSYFCLSPNDKLLAYWDTVADRLFKIRHCQNADGKVQQLPLYDPPIDPSLLVAAAASGKDTNSLLDELSGIGAPYYRFTYLVQKANEFCNDVKALGGALLSALEKNDAEELALLRQGHELTLLNAVLTIKKIQLDEAQANLDALQKSKENVLIKKAYYKGRLYMNAREQQHMTSLQQSIDQHTAALVLQELAQAASLIPQFHATPTSVGSSFGGQQISSAINMITNKLNFDATITGIVGSMASTMGGYDRRQDDWTFQADTAQLEADQLDKQIIAAQIRIAVADKEYANQKLQIDNALEVDGFMRSKFTNNQLYDWMAKKISDTYFSAYQLASAMAKKAERAYQNELPLSKQAQKGFIKGRYWDSLKKGLLAGENLQYDIRTMESTYIDENKRTLELTKHVSLATFAPESLLALKATGHCNISIPEYLYDIDYPTHYNRVIKSVSISIPCIAGPYATVPCTLSYGDGYVRRQPGTDEIAVATGSDRISSLPCSTIATSSAQNDNGVFDFTFRDERYLPFEGGAAVCSLGIDMGGLTDPSNIYPFNYATINDVVLHIKYTALEGGSGGDRSNMVYTKLSTSGGTNLKRLFSLKHEFPAEWYAFVSSGSDTATMDIPVRLDHFPFVNKNKQVHITSVMFATRSKTADYAITINGSGNINSGVVTAPVVVPPSLDGSHPTATFHLSIMHPVSGGTTVIADIDNNLDDIYMIVQYSTTTH